ncbi:hypothetical protein SK069_05760 [Patulibacter brassicae]|uniref:Uncharacterized protein n=1 Tax=Patulibacter brassicae TaxID=1705717 RepID=A0ABU4VH02_9ACTN|nr:hypothetical protein [Patulibacter brassicae]MDX8151090.1 hypothetical protein [Patulibacter brassicae]
MSVRAAAAAQRPRMARALRKVEEARRELAKVADGVHAEVLAEIRITHPDQVDELADLLRGEAAQRPLAVLVTTPPTTPADHAGEEAPHAPKHLRR